jgi:hypothetical protein
MELSGKKIAEKRRNLNITGNYMLFYGKQLRHLINHWPPETDQLVAPNFAAKVIAVDNC